MSKLPRVVRGERQKELVRTFDAACGAHNRWEVWSDAMVMYAVAISNAVDKSHYERREEIYRSLSKKYTEREMDCIVRMFALIVESMEENPDQDFLGDLYMALELGNQKNGQFFTPYSVCAMMAKMQPDIQERIDRKGWIAVNDPACGAGALLVAFANECVRRNIDYHTKVLFVAQDIDFVTGCMCYIQLSLLGCPGYVVVGDTIANPATSIDGRALIPTPGENVWYTPLYFEETWHLRRRWNLMDVFLRNAADKPVEMDETITEEIAEIHEQETGQLMLF